MQPQGASSSAERVRDGASARNLRSIVMFGLALAGVLLVDRTSDGAWTLLGVCSVGYLALKLALSIAYSPSSSPAPAGLRTAVVVPSYNEDPLALSACLESILAQSHPVSEIWVIDDGSATEEALDAAREVLRGRAGAVVHRLPTNVGKRHAQAFAFTRTTADVIVTVDSDTVLDRDAIAEGLRPFADARVMAVTGNVRVLNARTNLLTRLTSLRYANAFLWERAAYSRLGSVLCCCGSLSFWRGSVVQENLEDYLSQTFLGVQVPYGDDRRLTNYALTMGTVVLQETSIAYTAVPERLGHYLRQQVRWNKSFFRETLWALRSFRIIRAVWLLTLSEVALWSCCLLSVLTVHAWRPAVTGEVALHALLFGVVMAYARSIRYLGSNEEPWREQLLVFATAPLYWLLSTFVLVPLRFVSLCSLKSGSWGTRSTVEVSLAVAAPPEHVAPAGRLRHHEPSLGAAPAAV